MRGREVRNEGGREERWEGVSEGGREERWEGVRGGGREGGEVGRSE